MSSDSTFRWSQEAYAASVSSRCWWYTNYDGGWGEGLSRDAELQEIVRDEWASRPLPDWAVRVATDDIANLPPCGHHSFPIPYLRVLDAIGAQRSNGFNQACYAADPVRKSEAMDYCLCLDAWLAGAMPESPAAELEALGTLRIDWRRVCDQLWAALGERAAVKELLVERALLQLRWWIKSLIWSNDLGSRFGRDEYLGPYAPTGSPATRYGNPAHPAPTFDLRASPKVQKIEARLAELLPDWEWFKGAIDSNDYGTHPCAPKAFRSLEKTIWAIGKLRPLEKDERVPDFLMASATYVNQDEAAAWWREFLESLRAWRLAQPARSQLAADVAERLRERTPLKEWLVRLYVRRLEMHEEDADIRRLVRPRTRALVGSRHVYPR